MLSPQRPPTSPSSALVNGNTSGANRKPRLNTLLLAQNQNSGFVANETFGAVGNKEDFEQTEKNAKLFAIVMDDAEVLESLYENLKFTIVSKRDQAMQKNDKNDQNVANVIRQWKWTQPLMWDFEKLVREYGFNLSPAEIQLHHEFVDFAFDEPENALASMTLAKTAMSKARLTGVRDNLRCLDKQYLGESGAPISKHCVALFELAHTDVLAHARLELTKTDSAIAHLEAQIEADRQIRDAAVARGDIPSIEPPHRNMIKNYVELLEAIQNRIVGLTSADDDTNVFRKNCAEVLSGARGLVKRLGDENRNLQTRCLADIRRSEAVRVDEGAKDAEAASGHKEFVVGLRDDLGKNQERQKIVLDKIAELTKELFTLTDQRRDLLSRLCEEKEVEERRSANFEEFSIVRAEHLPYIDRIRDLTERRLGAEQGLADFVNEMQRRYDEMDIEGMLDELVEPELKKYIATYRSLVYTVGDLMTKKSLRVENLLRQRRQLKLQQELAVSSLDNEMGTYVQKHDDLTKQLNQAQTDLAFLQHTQNVGEKNFSQLSALQQRFGLQCLHPLVEFAAQSAKDRQKFADAATRYVDDENAELDKSKAHVRQLIAINEVERTQTPGLGSAAAFSVRSSAGAASSSSKRFSVSVNQQQHHHQVRPATSSTSYSSASPSAFASAKLPYHQQQEQQQRQQRPSTEVVHTKSDAHNRDLSNSNRPIDVSDTEEEEDATTSNSAVGSHHRQHRATNELMEDEL